MPYASTADFDANLQDPVVRRPWCGTLLLAVLLIAAVAWDRFDRAAILWYAVVRTG